MLYIFSGDSTSQGTQRGIFCVVDGLIDWLVIVIGCHFKIGRARSAKPIWNYDAQHDYSWNGRTQGPVINGSYLQQISELKLSFEKFPWAEMYVALFLSSKIC